MFVETVHKGSFLESPWINDIKAIQSIAQSFRIEAKLVLAPVIYHCGISVVVPRWYMLLCLRIYMYLEQ